MPNLGYNKDERAVPAALSILSKGGMSYATRTLAQSLEVQDHRPDHRIAGIGHRCDPPDTQKVAGGEGALLTQRPLVDSIMALGAGKVNPWRICYNRKKAAGPGGLLLSPKGGEAL